MRCEPRMREIRRNILGLGLISFTNAVASGIAAVDSNLTFVVIGRVETANLSVSLLLVC